MHRRGSNAGFSLIEVMIAAVILVILALGLAGSLGAAFMADASARNTATSTNAAQQLMEELQGLDYADVLGCDGDSVVTAGGVALKVSVAETMVGMLVIEVYACHPVQPISVGVLSGMTMSQLKNVPAILGSQVRLVTYRASRQ